MKNKSIIAKLLAEEDIFVVYKKMETAYFNPKSRELGLPIWNDEMMTPNIEDLMVCHEIAHALWTPLDMLEQARVRKINHSFVNIIEDVRIEQKVQERYRGSVAVFNRGYDDLAAKDFFGIDDKDVSKLNLIDRINLFFKIGSRKQKIEFSDEENVWVKKVSKCETPDDVLNVAEELYKWMKENQPEEEQEEQEENSPADSEENSDESNDTESNTSSSEEGEEVEEGEEKNASNNAGSANNETGEEETGGGKTHSEEIKQSDDKDDVTTGNGSGGKNDITAATDTDVNNAIEKLIDENATDRVYANIPDISGDDIIIKYDDIIKESTGYYNSNNAPSDIFYSNTKEAVVNMKADSKKTVAYMVKEFEMKKSADQYARASVSKSGSLDMGRLHTYKYNDDLFKKVTTLPGATNHGMVMVVDWSGSMYENLTGTLSQLYNLIWFCRRTQIPFEVYAFSNSHRVLRDENGDIHPYLESFKAGNLVLDNMKLLNFFSNKMTVSQEMTMMHFLWMVANQFGYNRNNDYGLPCSMPSIFGLSSTPLNHAIIAMMNIVPKFKKETGVQKVNTIFLTDGNSNSTRNVYDYRFDERKNEHLEIQIYLGSDKDIILTDPKTRKSYEIKNAREMTDPLLKILKDRVEGMNLIGFFIAGSGRSGRIDKRIISYITQIPSYSEKMSAILKKVNKEKFYSVTGDVTGYDELYLLSGGDSLQVENGGLSDDLAGASKAKLKSAFGKSMKSKITSRQLLNKFVKLVA